MAKDRMEFVSRDELVETYVPFGIRVASAWSWRLIVIGVVAVAFAVIVAELRIVVIPVMVALLFATLLKPLVELLTRRLHVPRVISVMVSVLLLLAVVGAMVWLVTIELSRGLDDVGQRAQQFYAELKTWLNESPLHLTEDQINEYLTGLLKNLRDDSQAIVSGALSVGTTAGHVLTGVLLTLFTTIFLLLDGRGIFNWVGRLFPKRSRAAAMGAGRAGWRTLSNYVRVQIGVAAIDAVGISIGAAILGLPLVVPLGIVVFLASFVPFVGAIVSGVLVCLVALIYSGWGTALIMAAIVIGVQQIESHVLQPLLMGTAVKVHPLGVVLAVAIGALIAGIPGTLFAVPVVASANAMIGYIASERWREKPPERSVLEEEQAGATADVPPSPEGDE